MPAAEPRSAVTSHRVYLVDENYRCGRLARGLEQVAHTRCADADVHLNEIRTGDREERHVRLTRDSLCKQRLTGTGRAHQQNAVRYFCAETRKFFGILQEFDDLLKLLFFLIRARDVLERHAVLFIRIGRGLDTRLAEAVHLAALARHLVHRIEPHSRNYNDNGKVRKKRYPPRQQCIRLVLKVGDYAAVVLLHDKIAEIFTEVIHILETVGHRFAILQLHGDDVGLRYLELGDLFTPEIRNDSGVCCLVAVRIAEQPRYGEDNDAYHDKIEDNYPQIGC